MKEPPLQSLKGNIISRKCPTCGHHEIGLVTEDGSFHPLKSGMFAEIFPGAPSPKPLPHSAAAAAPLRKHTGKGEKLDAWIPDPAKKNKKLRLLYGVLIPSDLFDQGMDTTRYDAAYLHKLEMLIEQEKETPLAVILDRFFTTPHLASGDSRDIASAMLEELDEVRAPVEDVHAWLADGTETALLGKGAAPEKREDQEASLPGPHDMQRELQALTLEDFLSLLTDTF